MNEIRSAKNVESKPTDVDGSLLLNLVEDEWISRLMDVAWKEKSSSRVLIKTTSLCYFNPKAT